jgi:hypothetical protein
LREHAAIGRDEAVPGICVVVQREQQLPVVERRQPWVDRVQRDECGVGLGVR